MRGMGEGIRSFKEGMRSSDTPAAQTTTQVTTQVPPANSPSVTTTTVPEKK
jgi:Sec-independent protein translocase protein TatA